MDHIARPVQEPLGPGRTGQPGERRFLGTFLQGQVKGLGRLHVLTKERDDAWRNLPKRSGMHADASGWGAGVHRGEEMGRQILRPIMAQEGLHDPGQHQGYHIPFAGDAKGLEGGHIALIGQRGPPAPLLVKPGHRSPGRDPVAPGFYQHAVQVQQEHPHRRRRSNSWAMRSRGMPRATSKTNTW